MWWSTGSGSCPGWADLASRPAEADWPKTGWVCDNGSGPGQRTGAEKRLSVEEDSMGKTGRKRRARKKKAANHGKRPNA